MNTLDAFNDRFGKKTVVLGREGFARGWTMRAALRSPRYTTRISDLPTVWVQTHDLSAAYPAGKASILA